MVTMTTTAAKRPPREESEDIIDRFLAVVRIEFPDAPKDVLADLAASLRNEYKGTTPYVRCTSIDQKARQLDKFRSIFNGRNTHECMRLLGIGRTTVYRWAKTQGPKVPTSP